MPVSDEIGIYFAEDTPPIRCTSLGEMEAILRGLHGNCHPEKPICVVIEVPHYQINLGLGTDPTFVMIHVEPYDGEYYITVGDPEAGGDVGFHGCGNWTPFDCRSFIPFNDALAVVREFVRDQQRSARVRWENWNQEPV
jgi:hypothetical protein